MTPLARRLVIVGLFMASVCVNGQGPASAVREEAYRANNRGVALLEQFNFTAAATAFRDALRIDPTLALARVNLSIALLYLPDAEAAAREAALAAQALPAAPQAAYVQGLAARELDHADQAMGFFERVQRLDPRDVGTAINIGQLQLAARRYDEAIAVLRTAVDTEPYNVTATYNLGLALTRSGARDEGQRLMEQSQALRGTGYGTTLSNNYLEQGRYAEAVASTGAEPDLVDPSVPPASFTLTTIASIGDGAASESPFGRRFAAGDLSPAGMRALAASLGGGLTLVDADGDGHLDLFVATNAGQRLYRNDNGRFVDITAGSGLGGVPAGAVTIGCIAGDLDNDGRPDLFVLRFGGSSLYHNEGNGRFTDVTAKAQFTPYPFLPGAAALVDVDHDGDLDLVIAGLADLDGTRDALGGSSRAFPDEFAGAPVQLLRNNGDGTFTDISREATVQAIGHAVAIVPTDFDNRRDIDLLIVNHDAPPVLFKNMRNGTFRNVAAEVALAPSPGAESPFSNVTSAAAADINKDDYPDFVFGRADQPGLFALSDGRGRYTVIPAPDGSRGAQAAQFVDYDSDGLFDLLTWSASGSHVLRNLGQRWEDVTPAAFPAQASASQRIVSSRTMAVADLDENGAPDIVSESPGGTLALFRNGGSRNRSMRVQLKGRVSNRSGVGSKIQLRAGSASARVETSAATPAVAAADVEFGIGSRPGADVVRVLWPSGILQAEAGTPLPPRQLVEELDRKSSSCPFLYTWNGERFEFVTDFMGAGEMGYWEGPGARNSPHPVEYVRIRDDQLKAKDGLYEIRVTNELEETLFLDRLQLLTVAHPRDVEVFPNEGMTDPPKPFRLYAARGAHPPARATDEHGHDVTAQITRLDRSSPDDFELKPFRGYAADHSVTLDLGPRESQTLLLLTAWTDYAFSSDNLAAHQAGLTLASPSLQIKSATGIWRTAIADIGIPVGRPQTLVVDLGGLLRPDEREVRLVTNMRIYWDQILVAAAAPFRLSLVRLDPTRAVLRERGFSAEGRPGGREPVLYDYERVSRESPWKTMLGRYTRLGDVRPLVIGSDDMFVVAKPGDEVAASFDARPLLALPPGWTRTHLLMGDGFSKEMDINSASPDAVEPLPFHRMTRYPYVTPEVYPDTARHRRYLSTFNTRRVVRSMPLLLEKESR
jgi:Tfp pilus assembly protein PilF